MFRSLSDSLEGNPLTWQWTCQMGEVAPAAFNMRATTCGTAKNLSQTMSGGYSEFVEAFQQAMRSWALSASNEQFTVLHRHYQAVVEGNRRCNLTRITGPREAAIKHYADSLALALWVKQTRPDLQTLLDIGTGAGFPAVPLAVMRPNWQVTAIDSTRKKTEFLTRCASDLRLTNLEVHHAHARHWKTRRRFDVVTMRAIGALALCVEQAAPFLAERGYIAVYKTLSVSEDERRAARNAAIAADVVPVEDFPYVLHLDGEVFRRLLCVYQRTAVARAGAFMPREGTRPP